MTYKDLQLSHLRRSIIRSLPQAKSLLIGRVKQTGATPTPLIVAHDVSKPNRRLVIHRIGWSPLVAKGDEATCGSTSMPGPNGPTDRCTKGFKARDASREPVASRSPDAA